MLFDYRQVSTETLAANIYKSIEGKDTSQAINIIDDALCKFGLALGATIEQEIFNTIKKHLASQETAS